VSSPRNNKPRAAEIAARAKRVVELRTEGKTFLEIAEELGVSVGTVHKDFEATIEHIAEPAVTEYRARQGAELRMMREVVQDVVQRRHLAINVAGVVRDEQGNPLKDEMPVLAAVDRLLKISDREAKLYGLDARPEIQITGTLSYEIVGAGADPLGLEAAPDNDDPDV
jgi:hypothetical protein